VTFKKEMGLWLGGNKGISLNLHLTRWHEKIRAFFAKFVSKFLLKLLKGVGNIKTHTHTYIIW